jgi:hypothetical protein
LNINKKTGVESYKYLHGLWFHFILFHLHERIGDDILV